MNVLGIIAEYNPFHLGHAYQIETLKRETHADYVIIAMSGNFVQRGAPALTDKYTRARMALEHGADLILELPVLYATASAEYFARGGVSLLHNTGVVTHLGFGAENANLPLLQKISDLLLTNPPIFSSTLQQELKSGLSFPTARSKALTAAFEASGSGDIPQIRELLSSPNNILAIEYLKALSVLSTSMEPVPLLRQGKGYHNTELTMSGNISEDFCSASAIRSYLSGHDRGAFASALGNTSMPESALSLLMKYPHSFLFENDFSQLVHYKLLTESPETLAAYADSSTELGNRIYGARHSFTSWSRFCELLKTKNTTYTRISRLLLHLILNISSTDYMAAQNVIQNSYLRVLGFQKSSAPLLSYIKELQRAPLITSVSNDMEQLSKEAASLLQMDITASDIYNLVLTSKGSQGLVSDYRQPLVIV